MDDNKAIRAGIVLGLIGLFSLGAYIVAKSFQSPSQVGANNDPVDFSEPAKKGAKGKRFPASTPSNGPNNARATGGRSYGDSGSSYDPPRVDARTDGSGSTGSFFTPDGQEVVPLDSSGSTASSGGSSGGYSDSSGRSPSSTDSSGSGSGGGIGGFLGGLGNMLGSSGSGTTSSTPSTTPSTSTPSTPSTPTPGTPAPTPGSPANSVGTTGGGGSVVQTPNNYKASVSIGVPLSGVSGVTTGGGNYHYQVNLSGQQSQ